MSEILAIQQTPDGVTFAVKAVPGSSRDQIVGLLGSALKVKVAAPPEGGQANRAVVDLLVKTLGVSRNQVEITAGHTRPQKRVLIRGLTAAQLSSRFVDRR